MRKVAFCLLVLGMVLVLCGYLYLLVLATEDTPELQAAPSHIPHSAIEVAHGTR